LFCLFAAGLALLALRKAHADTRLIDKGETIFTLAQYMGIVSGLLGLFLTFLADGRQIPVASPAFCVPFTCFSSFPTG